MHKYNNYKELNKYIFFNSNNVPSGTEVSEESNQANNNREAVEVSQVDLVANAREVIDRDFIQELNDVKQEANNVLTRLESLNQNELNELQRRNPDIAADLAKIDSYADKDGTQRTTLQIVGEAFTSQPQFLENYGYEGTMYDQLNSYINRGIVSNRDYFNTRFTEGAATNAYAQYRDYTSRAMNNSLDDSTLRGLNNIISSGDRASRLLRTMRNDIGNLNSQISDAQIIVETEQLIEADIIEDRRLQAQREQDRREYYAGSSERNNRGNTEGYQSNELENLTSLDGQSGTVRASSIKVRDLSGAEIRGERFTRGETIRLEGEPIQLRINNQLLKFGKVAESGNPGKYVALGFLNPNISTQRPEQNYSSEDRLFS